MFEARLEERKAAQAPETLVQTVVDENAPIVKVVNLILEQAVRDRASDVHIEPKDDTRARPRPHRRRAARGPDAARSDGPALVSRIKVMADMNIVERRRPQDGQIERHGRRPRPRRARVDHADRLRREVRAADPRQDARALIELRAARHAARDATSATTSLIRSPYGMVICAGPTGSGKTTTLYATLAEINSDEINIMTIEDPVEYVFPSINQIQINEQAGVTFADGLRSILRQDPDAILVGEIRDVETARIAVQSALTGHFVDVVAARDRRDVARCTGSSTWASSRS